MPDLSHPAHQRVLDAAERKGVTLEIVLFSESTHTAADAARAVGADLGQIVKSLVFVAPTEHGLEAVVALVSGSNRVDIAGSPPSWACPDCVAPTPQEAGEATGFVIGGIPPFGHRRALRVVMDPDLGRFTIVWAAAGTPNAVFKVPPATLRIPRQRDGGTLRRNASPTAPTRLRRRGPALPRARDAGPEPPRASHGRRTGGPHRVSRAIVQYPGGLSARYRWIGSGGGRASRR